MASLHVGARLLGTGSDVSGTKDPSKVTRTKTSREQKKTGGPVMTRHPITQADFDLLARKNLTRMSSVVQPSCAAVSEKTT